MTDKAVDDLTGASPLVGTELFYADDGAADVKVTATQIKTFTNTGLTSGIANVVEDTSPTLGGNLDADGFSLTGVAGSYTTTGAELVPGGDLAADPFSGFGWTKDDTSAAWSGGVLTLTANGTTEFGTFYIPLSLTAGSRYLLEVHQTLSANVMVFAGFSNNFNILIPCTESTVKAEFYATYTGSFTLYGYLNNKVAATNEITSISIKELSAVSSSLTVEDFAENTIADLGDYTGNLAIGVGAGDAFTTGSNNICLGHDAGTRITTSKDNIAIGSGALASCATGSGGGVCIGTLAGAALTTGIANIAIGAQALMNTTTGQQNVAIGNSALGGNTTGIKNIALGFAGTGNTEGNYNTYIGHNAATNVTTGLHNICIGYNVGLTLVTGTDNILIGGKSGATVDVPTSGASGYLNIGNAITGDMAAGPLTFSVDVIVPDEAYDATGWNASLEVPTKNAVRDKIEGLSSVYQPLDSDLTSWAGVTRAANFDTFAAGGTLTHGANFIEMTEMAAPVAGAANTARLFIQDNGAAKSQLCVRFPSGAVQVIATEV
jgi:hypothetical protein